jgi:hypothetical protein
MAFTFGFSFANLGDDCVNLVLPGVNGDDRAVLPVNTDDSGDTDFFPDLDALITLGGGVSSFQPVPYHVHGGLPSASQRAYSPYQ